MAADRVVQLHGWIFPMQLRRCLERDDERLDHEVLVWHGLIILAPLLDDKILPKEILIKHFGQDVLWCPFAAAAGEGLCGVIADFRSRLLADGARLLRLCFLL